MRHAAVLFSGGIDSTTALYWARGRFDRVSALSFDYGQRHRVELKLARRLTSALRIPHHFIDVDLAQIGGSALTDPGIDLPPENVGTPDSGPPATYVPFRNGILLSLAAAWGEVHGARDLVCGFDVIDSPEYPDTREVFVRAMQEAVNQGTGAAMGGIPFALHAPFVKMNKADILRLGLELGADYSFSISCYAGAETPCGACSACLIRGRAWRELGENDHLVRRLKEE